MKKEVKVLIVDDHPMILEGYKNAILDLENETLKIDLSSANDCDSALQKLKKASVTKPFDIVLYDINLPASSDHKILSGEDLALKTRSLQPETKIMVLTMYSNNFRIHNILRNIDPEGFLIKSDLDSEELKNAFVTVLNDPPYYSHTVTKLFRSQLSNDFIIDDYDRSILYHISIGTKTKNLPNYIPLSLAAIEKRKRNLKDIFDVTGKGDKALIEKSKEKGFI